MASRAGSLTIADTSLLVCPSCRAALAYRGPDARGPIARGALDCAGCGAAWPIEEGLPRLYREEEVRGPDRLMRVFYDGLPGLHEASVRWLLPVLELGGSSRAIRDAYMRRIELGALRPRADGRPVRILEVGVGAGANLPLIERDLPSGLEVQIWGADLSAGMLGECRGVETTRRVRLVMADAHALPFPDASFDRVFHVGGIGGYRDPRRGLAEMARVAEPGTPIVVVDEQLDPRQRQGLYHRLAFWSVTFYSSDPRCPTHLLPEGATGVIEEQISRFYYGLTFRMQR